MLTLSTSKERLIIATHGRKKSIRQALQEDGQVDHRVQEAHRRVLGVNERDEELDEPDGEALRRDRRAIHRAHDLMEPVEEALLRDRRRVERGG